LINIQFVRGHLGLDGGEDDRSKDRILQVLRGSIMAFTCVETEQAHEAVTTDPTGEDLCTLGILYSTGQGGEIDYIEAHKWFNLAALMGSEPAKHYRLELSDQMSSMEVAAAQRAAREWLSSRH
jgi:TPR repeat protein